MIQIGKNILLVRGKLYTNMPFKPDLLSQNGPVIHVKGDVIFGVWTKPNKMKTWDYYMDWTEFIKRYGMPPSNIIAFSKI